MICIPASIIYCATRGSSWRSPNATFICDLSTWALTSFLALPIP